ncbi:MAG: response regulator [Lachnospiraceae bacterium]|nr:response regulator [Lachnospiraceae bacterium]
MQKILVVEDVEMNRELLWEILETDYIVETVDNGERAIQVLQDDHDEIAALLLDLQMPKTDGFTVIAKMRENGWMDRIPVLIISGELLKSRNCDEMKRDKKIPTVFAGV